MLTALLLLLFKCYIFFQPLNTHRLILTCQINAEEWQMKANPTCPRIQQSKCLSKVLERHKTASEHIGIASSVWSSCTQTKHY